MGQRGQKQQSAPRHTPNNAPFETIADAFAIFTAMEGKRVVIDDMQWIPPLIPEGGIQ